eukprot:GHVL01002940.1.p1 GENE.GHVL01002940.1~~GHVL01002940.1.p1  ORF type:complete len:384 (+),score=54.39 GHVL01002940.1:97-1248(+)
MYRSTFNFYLPNNNTFYGPQQPIGVFPPPITTISQRAPVMTAPYHPITIGAQRHIISQQISSGPQQPIPIGIFPSPMTTSSHRAPVMTAPYNPITNGAQRHIISQQISSGPQQPIGVFPPPITTISQRAPVMTAPYYPITNGSLRHIAPEQQMSPLPINSHRAYQQNETMNENNADKMLLVSFHPDSSKAIKIDEEDRFRREGCDSIWGKLEHFQQQDILSQLEYVKEENMKLLLQLKEKEKIIESLKSRPPKRVAKPNFRCSKILEIETSPNFGTREYNASISSASPASASQTSASSSSASPTAASSTSASTTSADELLFKSVKSSKGKKMQNFRLENKELEKREAKNAELLLKQKARQKGRRATTKKQEKESEKKVVKKPM